MSLCCPISSQKGSADRFRARWAVYEKACRAIAISLYRWRFGNSPRICPKTLLYLFMAEPPYWYFIVPFTPEKTILPKAQPFSFPLTSYTFMSEFILDRYDTMPLIIRSGMLFRSFFYSGYS